MTSGCVIRTASVEGAVRCVMRRRAAPLYATHRIRCEWTISLVQTKSKIWCDFFAVPSFFHSFQNLMRTRTFYVLLKKMSRPTCTACVYTLHAFPIFSEYTGPHFTEFSALVHLCVETIDLTFVFRLLRRRCYGNQFWAESAKLAYVPRVHPLHCYSKTD